MRDVFEKDMSELQLRTDQLPKLLRPLYGLTDSGDYWHE